MLNHLHEVKYYLFSGLDYSEIGNENNFLHLNRQYCQPKGQNNDVRPDYNGSIDFLQSIDKDIPKGILFAYYFQRKLLMNSFNFFIRLLGFSAFLKSIFYYSQFAMARCCVCPRHEYWSAWLLLQRIWPEKLRFTIYDLISYRFVISILKYFL